MMGVEKPDKPYIVIESITPPRSLLNSLNHREEERCLHVISMTEGGRPLKVGRGHGCEIRISDISVSRSHASIEFTNDKFLILDDNKSKFGTLVLFDEEFVLNEKQSLKIQSGRCLYELSIGKERMKKKNEGATESENDQDM